MKGITKKPAITIKVERLTMMALQETHNCGEVATRMCDGEEGYLDVSVYDDSMLETVANILGCKPKVIKGNLLVLVVED